MFQIVKPDINIDFIRLRRAALVFSALLILLGVTSLVAKGGPTYGIDFTGGLMVQVRVDQDTDIARLRQVVSALDVGEISVQSFENEENEFLVRVPQADESLTGGTAEAINSALVEGLGGDNVEIRRTAMVGARVGHHLRPGGIWLGSRIIRLFNWHDRLLRRHFR